MRGTDRMDTAQTPKYPIGHQDFKKIITEGFVYVDKTRYVHKLAERGGYYFLSRPRRFGFVYVDKTRYVHKLAERGGYYFLSRPRRFGKSLLISTLYHLFKGEQALFDGLYIRDQWTFQEYPVIRISFSEIGYREMPLDQALQQTLDGIATHYGLTLKAETPSLTFKALIRALYEQYQQQVVILIDEYDKPIIDYLDAEQLHQAKENRDILKSFYSVIKDADAYLKLFFITG
ncbi:unnamed protein product, partial [Cyprideis torosa]